jgi:hypothetical protein
MPGRLRCIALILAGFAVFGCQICSQMRLVGSAAWLSAQPQAAVSADSFTNARRDPRFSTREHGLAKVASCPSQIFTVCSCATTGYANNQLHREPRDFHRFHSLAANIR